MLSATPIPAAEAAHRQQLLNQISDRFMQFVRQLHATEAGPWLQLELTMPQLKTLLVVDWLGPIPMSHVAGQLGIGVSAATGLMDRLVEHGLAHREHDVRDRRIVRVASTPAGHELIGDLRSASGQRVRRILDHLSINELERFAELVQLINCAADTEFQLNKEQESRSSHPRQAEERA